MTHSVKIYPNAPRKKTPMNHRAGQRVIRDNEKSLTLKLDPRRRPLPKRRPRP